MAIKKKKAPTVQSRRVVGLYVARITGHTVPNACAIYEEVLSDGTTRTVRGSSIFTCPSYDLLNPAGVSKKRLKAVKDEYMPQMHVALRAASVLFEDIENACMWLDEERGRGPK